MNADRCRRRACPVGHVKSEQHSQRARGLHPEEVKRRAPAAAPLLDDVPRRHLCRGALHLPARAKVQALFFDRRLW